MSRFRVLTLVAAGLTLAGCNTMTASNVADIACLGAETTSTIAAIAASDFNADTNGTSRTARAESVANAVQKTVNDLCPAITTGAAALSAAVAASAASK